MLTFTSLGGKTIHCVNGGKALVVFPDKPEGKDVISLLSNPEKEPTEGVISWPGEYDYDGVAVRGIWHDESEKVSYAIEINEIRVAFLSSPLKEWTDYELELLGDIDILFMPADDVKIAQKLIDLIDPRTLIPLLTKDEETFEELLDKCGAKGKEPENEYKVKGKSSLPAEGREVVILKAKK
ncbi:hypothetical protein KKF55_04100 [Patescibacteria group bacterium]|nr:hypothetical protein [Patescibacteria group bacterium]